MTTTSAPDRDRVRSASSILDVQSDPFMLGVSACVCLSGAGEDIVEAATVNTLFIVPKAEPTQDSTKDFTPKVETSTSRDAPKDTKKRNRIEVGASYKNLQLQQWRI